MKLISCWDLKEHHIIIIIIKNQKGKISIEFPQYLSVCDNKQNFTDSFSTSFSTVAVAQWVRSWSSEHRVVQAEGSSLGGDTHQTFFSALSGLIDFRDMVILRSGPNSCCQQNLKCFDICLYYR